MCLDVGTKRIGIAKSDDLGLAAHPLTVIDRRSRERDFERIIELCREHGATTVVVGLPLDENGGIGPAARRILAFVDTLKGALVRAGLAITVATWDERYSTAEALELLIGADMSRAKRRRVIDKMAAARILQSYMDHHEKGERGHS